MIEIETFRLAPGIDDEEFVRADSAFQQQVAYQRRGLLRRTTARGEHGEWVVVTLWRDAAAADAPVTGAEDVASAHAACIDATSRRLARYDELPG